MTWHDKHPGMLSRRAVPSQKPKANYRRPTPPPPQLQQWRHNGRDGVSNHDCLRNRLFRRRSRQTSKIRVTGLCAGNSPVTGEFHAQMASNAENIPCDDVIMTHPPPPLIVLNFLLRGPSYHYFLYLQIQNKFQMGNSTTIFNSMKSSIQK